MAEKTADEQARATIARLADELLPTLMARLAQSELGEIEVRENGWRIRLRRPSAALPAGIGGNSSKPSAAVAEHAATRALAVGPGVHPAERQPRSEPARDVVTSPAVGYFVPRENVAVGAALRAGDVIGHVDMLGVRHEVVSPRDGALRSIEVEPGAAVEYGEPIARVEAELPARIG